MENIGIMKLGWIAWKYKHWHFSQNKQLPHKKHPTNSPHEHGEFFCYSWHLIYLQTNICPLGHLIYVYICIIYILIYSCCLQLLLDILLAIMFHPNHGAMPPSTHPTLLEPCGTRLGQWMHWWHNKLFHSVNETWPWKIHSMVYI